MFVYIRARFRLALVKIWQFSRGRATGELEVEFKIPRDVVASSPSPPPRRQQSAQESLLAG